MKNRLLVVEDEPEVSNVYKDYFSDIGFQVDCAESAEEALHLANNNSYLALLSDLRLRQGGVQEGLGLLKRVHEHHPEIPIAVLSGAIDAEVAHQVRQLGVRAIMQKPKPLSEIGQLLLGMTSDAELFRTTQLPTGMEIARLVVRGATHEQIAKVYGTSEDMVRNILSAWFNALPAHDRIAISFQLSREAGQQ